MSLCDYCDTTTIVAILTAITCTIFTYLKYCYGYWTRKGVHQADPNLFFGNVGPVLLQRKNFGENLLHLYNKCKAPGRRFFGTYFMTRPEIVILDPELAKTILTKDFHNFPDRAIQHDTDREPISAHLLELTGTRWKNLRQKLTPTFTSGKMKMMFSTFVSCSSQLEDTLEDFIAKNEAIDIKEVLGRFTTDIIGSCAFGIECNSLKNPDAEFRKYGKLAFDPTPFMSFKRLIGMGLPKVYDFFRMTKTDSSVTEFFTNVVKDTVEYREKNQVKRNDFMQLLINIKNTGDVEGEKITTEPGKSLTMDEITAQSFLFFLAGFETSSTTMTFFLYDMATNQDIQDRVRQEIQDMLKRHDGQVTYEGVMELQYLDRAIKESMRIHSAIPMLIRRSKTDYKIPDSDVIIQKDTRVIIPVIGFQSDPEYYPEPQKYDPDRFLPEEKEKRHPFTFLPFGEGPRNCIGLRFGLLQTKVGLIVLMRNHRFTLSKRTQLPMQIDPKNIIFSVLGGIWLNAQRL